MTAAEFSPAASTGKEQLEERVTSSSFVVSLTAVYVESTKLAFNHEIEASIAAPATKKPVLARFSMSFKAQ